MKKDGSFVVLFKNDQKDGVFLVYRSDWPIWNLTGGGVEPGEDPKKTAIREAFEETSFKIKIVKKVGVYEYLDPKTQQKINLSHLYYGYIVSGTFVPEFPECKGEWFKINNLPVDITDKTKERIIDAVNFTGKEFYKKTFRAQLKSNLHLMLRHPLATLKYFTRK